MKKKNLLQKYIHHIKTMVYNWLSKSVKKEKPRHAFDYERYSWFNPKYFKHKLKRKIMSITYKLYTSIEESLLETYFIELEFETIPSQTLEKVNKERVKKNLTELKGDYKGYLPLLLKVRNFDEATKISSQIQMQLIENYGNVFSETDINVSQLKSETDIEIAIEKANNVLARYNRSKIVITTRTPKTPKIETEISFKCRVNANDIGFYKQNDDLLGMNFDYSLIIYKESTEV